MMALSYVSHIASETGGLLRDVTDAQRDGESAVDRLRRISARQAQDWFITVSGTWQVVCANELLQMNPSDAGMVARFLMGIGQDWRDAFGHGPFLRDYAEVEERAMDAPEVLDAMCPAGLRETAESLVDWILSDDTREAPIEEISELYPTATVHAAAALLGSSFTDPLFVPDHVGAQVRLLHQISDLNHQLTGRDD